MGKGVTVRLSDEDAAELEAVAPVDGVTFATIAPVGIALVSCHHGTDPTDR